MLAKRTITALLLALLGLPAMYFGGLYYFLVILFFLTAAAWEYAHIFDNVNSRISKPVIIAGVILIGLSRKFLPDAAVAVFVFSILAAMAWHLLDYELGRDQAATDFAGTASGLVYIGWIGAYLIDLRNMPGGIWWLATVLPCIWLADMAAFFIGSRFGKHPLSPRLSPKKTWEGYWAGIIAGTAGTAGLVLLWHSLGGPAVVWWKGAALGAALSVLTTLGDLGESMLKRQAGMKDASNIFPGHGGVLDRIDSWLWGAVLGFFLITWFLL
jgi:phosphatidate cytidylyltransferase